MDEKLHDDLLIGAEAISEYFYGPSNDEKERRRKRRKVYGDQNLPIFHHGKLLCARKSTIRQRIAEKEAANLKRGEADQ